MKTNRTHHARGALFGTLAVLMAVSAVTGVIALTATPATAQDRRWDNNNRDQRRWNDRDDRRWNNNHWDQGDWRRNHPNYYVAPGPVYAPPPVVYAPQPVYPGFSLHLGL